MSHGRPDYWQSAIQGLPSPMGGQSMFRLFEEADIGAGATLDMNAYTNPDDRILYITGILMHTNSRCLNSARMSINAIWCDYLYWISTLPIPLHPSAFYEVLQGEAVFVRTYNTDIYTRHFGCTILGYEELG